MEGRCDVRGIDIADPQTQNEHTLGENISQHDVLRPASHVIVQGLDKVTGRILTLKTLVGKPITFGRLKILAHRCFKTLPEEIPEAIAEIEIYETLPASTTDVLIFKNYMYASSPSISALDHSVYDVWIKDCF